MRNHKVRRRSKNMTDDYVIQTSSRLFCQRPQGLSSSTSLSSSDSSPATGLDFGGEFTVVATLSVASWVAEAGGGCDVLSFLIFEDILKPFTKSNPYLKFSRDLSSGQILKNVRPEWDGSTQRYI